MTITIEEIKEAFEVAFDSSNVPLEKGYIWRESPTEILRHNGDAIIEIYEYDHGTHLVFGGFGQMEKLVLNLPTICKMLLDATAEIERLNRELLERDKEIERLKSDEGYIYTVQFQNDWWRERDSDHWEESLSFDTLEEAREHIAECEEENIDNSKYRVIRERVEEEVIE